MNNENLTTGWHIDKRFTVGHIITTLVVGISAIMYITGVEKRVSLLEAKMAQQDLRMERISEAMLRGFDKMESHLIRIETKMDGKADK